MTARARTWMAGAAVVACVSILLTDYGFATWRAPRDDKLIKALQQQVKENAGQAARLAAEQKRITEARRSRKSRDNTVGWLLIVSSAAFLIFANRLVKPGRAAGKSATPSHAVLKPRAARAASADLDLTFIDDLISQYGRANENAIALLQAIQSHYHYLPDDALRRLCELTQITPAQLAGTSSFYKQFRSTPTGKHIVRVCHGTACHVAGARQISDELRRYLALPEGADTDPSRTFTLDEAACFGCCSLAPVLMVDETTAGRLTPSGASAALARFEETHPA